MEDIIATKAHQCLEFRVALVQTGHRRLAYKDLDLYWGIGHHVNGRWVDGSNVLAKCLGKVRSIRCRGPKQPPPQGPK